MTAEYQKGYNAAIEMIRAMLASSGDASSSSPEKLDPRLDLPEIPNSNKSKSQDKNERSSNNALQIGDQGNSDIQQAEEKARQENAYSDDEGNIIDKTKEDAASKSRGSGFSGSDSSTSSTSSDSEDDQDDIKSLASTGSDKSNTPDLSRGEKVKKAFSDIQGNDTFRDETIDPVNKESELKAAREASKYTGSSLARFKDSLNKFIRDATEIGKERSWKRLNKNAVSTGLLKKGLTRLGQTEVPLINVYFDQSGSWGPEKIKVGEQAIATLNKYIQRHEIIVKLYYFSNNVHTTPAGQGWSEGGTEGEPILRHIVQTKPNNVIIMTDSDIDDCVSDITVDGAVWFLFKGGKSENLMQHLHGKQLTKSFEI